AGRQCRAAARSFYGDFEDGLKCKNGNKSRGYIYIPLFACKNVYIVTLLHMQVLTQKLWKSMLMLSAVK
ncbi:hypothetical protein, partial [Phascolarctobacterium faecium]|uniref:hypothetical protein n=1 Tax=Phascolarctobacterium faecium TaxID=33025 RepID=UPI003AF01082